ncbi:MAG: hypothetical protein HPZ91_02810 [Lentisphaeria bacterium]|nr:hypothetical protein [Lentisphaeria bacterium]
MLKMSVCLLAALLGSAPALLSGDEIGAGHEYDNIRFEEAARSSEKVLPASFRLLPRKELRSYDRNMFGLSYDFADQDGIGMAAAVPGKPYPELLPDFTAAARDVPLPLNRLWILKNNWKQASGPVEARVSHKQAAWAPARIQITGPLETVRAILAADPQAQFDMLVSVGDAECVKQAREIAEFFTGNASTEWGKKRAEWGLPEPVRVAIWELGNETDWNAQKLTPEAYVRSCREVMAAIRSVDPDAKFAPHAATAPWHETQSKHWKEWHRAVLAELAGEIDYFAFHPYYHGYPVAFLEKYLDVLRDDIARSSNPQIRIFISEHGLWPGGEPGRWENSWYKTHALQGCLAVSEWFNRMLARPEVTAMTMHACSSGPWGMFYPDPYSGRVYATGLAELFKFYKLIPYGGKVIGHELQGEGTAFDDRLTLSATAVEQGGKRYILLTNRLPETGREIALDLAGGTVEHVYTLTAGSVSEVNTAVDKPIAIRYRKGTEKERIRIPARSVTLLVCSPAPVPPE